MAVSIQENSAESVCHKNIHHADASHLPLCRASDSLAVSLPPFAPPMCPIPESTTDATDGIFLTMVSGLSAESEPLLRNVRIPDYT